MSRMVLRSAKSSLMHLGRVAMRSEPATIRSATPKYGTLTTQSRLRPSLVNATSGTGCRVRLHCSQVCHGTAKENEKERG
jgi:hypothetical protein